jgi:hypothetical protein
MIKNDKSKLINIIFLINESKSKSNYLIFFL